MTIDYTFRPCLVSTPGTARATIRIIERVPTMQGYWESDPSTPTLYEEEVRRLLDRVFRTRVGQCVWHELCQHWQHDRAIVITPNHSDPTRSNGTGTYLPPRSDAESRAAPATIAGTACGRAPVPVGSLSGFRHPSLCRGEVPRGGIVYFHPMHPPPPAASASTNAIPRDPGHVLFHEIIHVYNQGMAGWRVGTGDAPLEFSDGRHYEYLDEFFAIMVANYLRAEEGAPLRRDHNGYVHMEEDARGQPEAWITNAATGSGACVAGNVTNRDLVGLYRRMHPVLAGCLASVGGSGFNPISQHTAAADPGP